VFLKSLFSSVANVGEYHINDVKQITIQLKNLGFQGKNIVFIRMLTNNFLFFHAYKYKDDVIEDALSEIAADTAEEDLFDVTLEWLCLVKKTRELSILFHFNSIFYM
jgi:hypothetical protein